MWIFSLGVTLKQTISSKYHQHTKTTGNDDNRIADVYHLSKSVNDVNNQFYGGGGGSGSMIGKHQQQTDTSALDKVILAMCEPRSTHRASLMFLLDVSILFFLNYFYTFLLSWHIMALVGISLKSTYKGEDLVNFILLFFSSSSFVSKRNGNEHK